MSISGVGSLEIGDSLALEACQQQRLWLTFVPVWGTSNPGTCAWGIHMMETCTAVLWQRTAHGKLHMSSLGHQAHVHDLIAGGGAREAHGLCA